jgi:hypothetical protein
LVLAPKHNVTKEERSKTMITTRKPVMSLYVDKARPEYWIVRDREGLFWIVPPGEDAWSKRERFHPSEDAELEAVPGHYLYMLGITS